MRLKKRVKSRAWYPANKMILNDLKINNREINNRDVMMTNLGKG
jgi:hypothetical protein